MKKILLEKEYDSESIVDIERHLYECFDFDGSTKDEYGFDIGVYKVIITYEEN